MFYDPIRVAGGKVQACTCTKGQTNPNQNPKPQLTLVVGQIIGVAKQILAVAKAKKNADNDLMDSVKAVDRIVVSLQRCDKLWWPLGQLLKPP